MATTLRRKVLNVFGYASFFMTSVVVLSYFTFPYDRVRDFIVQEVEFPKNAAGLRAPSGYRLEIDELSPSWVTGVSLSGVRLKKMPTEPDERPITITIDEATARISVLALLTGGIEVSVNMQTAGGTLSVVYGQKGDETHILADIESLDLQRLGILQALAGLPFAGVTNGHVDLTLGATPAAAKGEVKLTITGLVIGNQNAKLKLSGMGEGLTIGRVNAGNFELEAKVENGTLRFNKMQTQGNNTDLTLHGGGSVRLGRDVRGSSLDTLLNVKFSDAFRERDDRTRAIFSIVDLNPELRRAKTNDGALQWQISGPFAGLRYGPAGNRPMPR